MANVNGTFGSVNRSATRFGKKALKRVDNKKETWTLASGEEVEFTEVKLSYEELRDNTFVVFENNGRNQELLTEQTLKRLSSLDKQQFYPAIGFKHEDGKIEILDGSSRRAYILNKKGAIKEFKLMLSDIKISRLNAKKLAKDIRSALEPNLYEIGEQASPLIEKGMTQRSIANELGFSQRKINLGLKTIVIPLKIMQLFPIVNDITWPNYQTLIKLAPSLPEDIELSKDAIDVETIIKELKNISVNYSNGYQEVKSKLQKYPLMEFEKGTRKKATKTVDLHNKKLQFTFERMGSKANEILEQKIAEAVEEIKQLNS